MPQTAFLGGIRGKAAVWAVLACAPLWIGILATSDRAEAQNAPPAGVVGVNPADNQLVFDPLNGLPSNLVIGFNQNPPFVYTLDPVAPLFPGTGCQHLDPTLPNLAGCLPIPPNPSLSGMTLHLQALTVNQLEIASTLPKLPGPNLIQGGANKDVVQGGQSDEQIKTGKGKDQIDAGPGEDDVNAGPGNDEIDTQDGEKDTVNGGKGKNDEATVDKKDKVKNVEKVKRK